MSIILDVSDLSVNISEVSRHRRRCGNHAHVLVCENKKATFCVASLL